MSSGTQIDLTSPNGGYGGTAASPASAPAGGGSYLSDEEILGITPIGTSTEIRNSSAGVDSNLDSVGASHPGGTVPLQSDAYGSASPMPPWMQSIAGDPTHGAEAQQLWREHQEFRAAFSSPLEARAIKEMFPGGAQEVRSLKEASQSVDRIDAALFSGDARAQSEVVAELARANPAAFRSLFAEAARVLSGMGATFAPSGEAAPTLRQNREEWGTRKTIVDSQDASTVNRTAVQPHRQDARGTTTSEVPATNHESRVTNHAFDPVAYSNFERSTNDAVARDVRGSIGDTLARVLPEGVAEGAARRIGDDIFNEIHRALAADTALSQQVGEALRAPLASGQGWRFGTPEQQRITAMLAGRAKQLVPGVARRVIGEWTSSVLGTARTKAARQAAAASRVDIGAPGGSLDSMPLRAMSPREINYASMSDDEILGM